MNFESSLLTNKGPQERRKSGSFETRIEKRGKREKEYADFLRGIITNPENFIDKGGAGEVFSFRADSASLCIKVVANRHDRIDAHMFNLGNSLLQEAHFLEHLDHFSIRDVRVPQYLEVLLGDRHGFLIMEQLDAVNLQHVIHGTESLPESFDLEDFFDSLDHFVTGIHEIKKVAHMDLEARNIMVDKKTGKPRVIDFGRAVFLSQHESLANEQRMNKDYQDLAKVEESIAKIYNSK